MKVSRFLPMREDTVVNYYVLPLVGLSRKDFGDNFVTTKINRIGTKVFVQVKEDIYPTLIYRNKVRQDNILYLYYRVPEKFSKDVQYIIKGLYSKITKKAKKKIVKLSGLAFNEKLKEGYERTSKLLYALIKDPILIDYYFEQLSNNIARYDQKLYETLQDVELMESIDETDFIDEK